MIKYVEITLMDTRQGGTERRGLLQKVLFDNEEKSIEQLTILLPGGGLMCVKLPIFFIKTISIIHLGFADVKDFFNIYMDWCKAVTEIKYCLSMLNSQGLKILGKNEIDVSKYIGAPEEYKTAITSAKNTAAADYNNNTSYFIKNVPKSPEVFFLRRKTEVPSKKELDILAKKLLSINEGTYITTIMIKEPEESVPKSSIIRRHFPNRVH